MHAAKGGFLAADPHRVRCDDGDGFFVQSLLAVRAAAEPMARARRRTHGADPTAGETSTQHTQPVRNKCDGLIRAQLCCRFLVRSVSRQTRLLGSSVKTCGQF